MPPAIPINNLQITISLAMQKNTEKCLNVVTYFGTAFISRLILFAISAINSTSLLAKMAICQFISNSLKSRSQIMQERKKQLKSFRKKNEKKNKEIVLYSGMNGMSTKSNVRLVLIK